MLDLEISFRAALHEERLPLAAVLLAQTVEARHTELKLVQVMRLQRICWELLAQRNGRDADALLQAAESGLQPILRSTLSLADASPQAYYQQA